MKVPRPGDNAGKRIHAPHDFFYTPELFAPPSLATASGTAGTPRLDGNDPSCIYMGGPLVIAQQGSQFVGRESMRWWREGTRQVRRPPAVASIVRYSGSSQGIAQAIFRTPIDPASSAESLTAQTPFDHAAGRTITRPPALYTLEVGAIGMGTRSSGDSLRARARTPATPAHDSISLAPFPRNILARVSTRSDPLNWSRYARRSSLETTSRSCSVRASLLQRVSPPPSDGTRTSHLWTCRSSRIARSTRRRWRCRAHPPGPSSMATAATLQRPDRRHLLLRGSPTGRLSRARRAHSGRLPCTRSR
jgi:hypothetical protein